jgi:predicted Zn-dependent protease with MMP-like domain
MNRDERKQFDSELDRVMADLPSVVHKLLDEVPLIVEDYPSDDVLDEMEIEYRDDLCGLYSGIPITDAESRPLRNMPDVILIYREGIISAATDDDGRVTPEELRRQIRITILHEVGHHFGLDEDDLAELGYE